MQVNITSVNVLQIRNSEIHEQMMSVTCRPGCRRNIPKIKIKNYIKSNSISRCIWTWRTTDTISL